MKEILIFLLLISFSFNLEANEMIVDHGTGMNDSITFGEQWNKFPSLVSSDVKEIIFAERGYGRDLQGHYYANFGYACFDPTIWMHAEDGSKLCKLNIRTGEKTILLDDPRGSIRDPQVHYDAKKILFSYRKGGTHNYNLFEIDIDGQNLRRITSDNWDDVEPTYLPDGGIIFSSSRCKRYILCWLVQSATLYRCDDDGSNIRSLSSNTLTENTPCILPDGRILYTRWEYVNRDAVTFHHLWTMNPDGTNQHVYFGNMHPGGVFIDSQAIPNTNGIVFINSHGHGRNEHEGQVALVTDQQGPDKKSAMKNISDNNSYRDPFPISQNTFLVAHKKQIEILDVQGKNKVLHTSSDFVHEPRPIIKRPREHVRPSMVDLTKTTGTLVLQDVYMGRNMNGIKRGDIKKLLVLEDLPKPANFHGGGSQPIGHGVTSTLKRILGTVPVEPDGSASFTVPASRSIYFAALDKDDKSIKQMRSFVTIQPGETLSCIGCHEERNHAPSMTTGSKLQALNRKPSQIEPIPAVPEVLDFPRDVQPILDRHCIKCHSSENRKGGVVLEGDHGPVFSLSFYNLILHWQVKDTGGNPINGTGRQNGNDTPYTTYSSASPLMDKIDGNHHDVKLTDNELDIVRLWIDCSPHYPGTYAALGTGQVGGCWTSNKYTREMDTDWPSTEPAQEAIERRCLSCHANSLPTHVTDINKSLSFGDMLSWERPMSRFSKHRIFNLSNPAKSLILMAPLANTSGGYAEGTQKEAVIKENKLQAPKPIVHPVVFKNSNDPDYKKILTHIEAAKDKLNEIKRFDMPGFKPNEHYVREMKRYGILPQSFDLETDSINVYETDRKYWESMWHKGSVSSYNSANVNIGMDTSTENQHTFLCSDVGAQRVFIVSESGEIEWEYPANQCSNARMLDNGNILMSFNGEVNSKNPNRGVREVSPEKKVVWEYKTTSDVWGCQRLPNGNTLIAECTAKRLIEVNRKGKIVKIIPINSTGRLHYGMRLAQKLSNGNYLVALLDDKAVWEYDSSGKMIRAIKVPDMAFSAVRLANGNTVIGYRNGVIEVDQKDKVVWHLVQKDIPDMKLHWICDIQRLPNGNTVVGNWFMHKKQNNSMPFFEVTPEKKVVWKSPQYKNMLDPIAIQIMNIN